MKTRITSVLNFCFKDCEPKDWFKKDYHFDNEVKNNFGDLEEDALLGYLNYWRKSFDGSLAFIILTDQFTRNIFKGNSKIVFRRQTCFRQLFTMFI